MSTTTAVRSRTGCEGDIRPGTRVVVGADSSYWGTIALGWARRHAAATDSDLRIVPRVSALALSGLLTASAGSRLLVLGCRDEHSGTFGLGPLVLPVSGSARCDTLIVRGLRPSISGVRGRITAMLSGGGYDHAVLRAAAEAAIPHGSEVRLLARPGTDTITRAVAWLTANAPSARFSAQVDDEAPHDAVFHTADSDVLVLGRGDPSRCGTVTRLALHHALCPVLVAR